MKKVIAVLLILFTACVFAQEYRDVAVGGEMLIRLRVGIRNLSLDERADRLDERLVKVLSLPRLRADDITLYQPKGKNPQIRVRGILLVEVTEEDATATKMSVKKLAEQWTETFKKKLPRLSAMPPQEAR